MYAYGQKVCLWDIKYERKDPQTLFVLKEVVVTITDIKTGVPGEFSRDPVSAESLQGCGDDGNFYEKHWKFWPEGDFNDFQDTWSMRDDSGHGGRVWIPREAIYIYNIVSHRSGERHMKIVDIATGETMRPKGDVSYCQKHDRYSYRNARCLWCRMDGVVVGQRGQFPQNHIGRLLQR